LGLLLWARLISSSRAAAGSATFPADVGSCTATCYNCSCAGNARSAVHLRISVYDSELALCGWVVPLSARIRRQTARLLTSHRPAAGPDKTVVSLSCLAERCTLRNNACSDFKLSVCDSLHSSGTTVRLYNWHSAGFLGWPFPMLQYKCIFREKIYGSSLIKRHSQTAIILNQ